jgi:D-glycero-D-manno-heptose 1,7-bisphosphate phosphatase
MNPNAAADTRRPCAFFDRDGVINRNAAPGEYIERWSDFEFIPAAGDWIRIFNALGYLVIVVTNQRGVARGRMTASEVDDLHERMRAQLAEAGARIDDVFYCPHEENACDCRKPAPGLIEQAAAKWDIDLTRSVMIGDSWRDAELAARCGLRFLQADRGRIVPPMAAGAAAGVGG